jgi:hypothetical protein
MLKIVFLVIVFSLIPLAFAQNDNACNGLTDENPVIITTDKPNYTYYDSKVIVSICILPEVHHKHIKLSIYDLQGNEMFSKYDPGFPKENTTPFLFIQEVPLDSFEKWQKYTVELYASGEDYHTYFGYGADVFQEHFSEKYNYYIYPTTFWRLSPHTTDDIARFDAEAPSTIDTFAPYFEITKLEVNARYVKFGDVDKIAEMHTKLFEDLAQETIGRQLDFEKDIIITDTFATERAFLHNIQVTIIADDNAREIHSTMLQTDASEIFIFTLYGSRAEVYDDRIQEFVDSVNTFSPLNEKQVIPEWIKNVFVWYGKGTVSEIELVSSLEFLISENIIEIEISEQQNSSGDEIPEWVKNVFVWYGEGTVSETELVSSLEFLISEGVIQIVIDDIIDAKLSESFVLDVGQTANIMSEEISITFVDVLNDSRCPEDDGVLCSWAGDASVLIEIQKENDITEMILHSNSYNRGDDAYHFDEYEILLDHLLPRASEYITLPYKAIISVNKTIA